MGECILGRDGRGFGKAGWDALEPWLDPLLVQFHELLGAGQGLANDSGVDVIRGEMERSLYPHGGIWRDVLCLGRVVQRIRGELLMLLGQHLFFLLVGRDVNSTNPVVHVPRQRDLNTIKWPSQGSTKGNGSAAVKHTE